MTSSHTPEQALADLEAVLRLVYQCLEAGTQEAREYFENRNEASDPYLFPHLVRYQAKSMLEAAGESVVEFESLANNGLLLRADGYSLRILKSDNGDLPAPGPSRARRAYYHQLDLFGLRSVNLVVLWDCSEVGILTSVRLVAPKSGGLLKQSVDYHWIIDVPHPAETPRERPAAEVEDIPLTPAENDLRSEEANDRSS